MMRRTFEMLRVFFLHESLKRAIRRNERAAAQLDVAVKEMFEK